MNTSTSILTVGTLILSSAVATFAAPRMSIENASFNFGYVPQNSAVSHVFWIRSIGDDSLKIIKVQPGCGCTQAPLDKREIAVGDSAKLEIIFHSKTASGRVSKSPSISTKEGPPDKHVTFVSDIVSRPDSTYPVIIDDYKLDMSQFSQRVMDKKKFKITNVSDKPLKLTIVSTNPDFFEIKLPNEIKPRQTGEGILTLTEKAISENFEKSFTFEFNDEKTTRFTVPVKRTMQMAAKPADSASKAVQPH